ncbi:anti-sigma factor [Streptomyces capparidis]
MSPCEHDLAAAYALDALPPRELARYERHLAGCAECAADVRDLRESVGRLADAVARPAPAGLRERVFARVAVVPQERPDRAPAPARAAVLAPRRVRARAARTRRSPLGRLVVNRVAWGLVAACVLVVTLLSVSLVRTQQELDRARALERRRAAVLTAPDARAFTARAAGGGGGTVVASERLDAALIAAHGLPALPSGRTYQLWLMRSGQARPAGFLPGDGRGGTDPAVVTGLADAARLALTVEPAGGSPRPTGPSVLEVALGP